MTKADIIEGVCGGLGGFSKREAAILVETILDVMTEGMVSEGQVKISGFGTFSVRTKHPRTGRNPKTGRPLQISAHKVLTFRASQILRKIVNS